MALEITNCVTGQKIDMSRGNDNYVVSEIDFGTVGGNQSTTKYINLIGSAINATSLGERDISIKGTVCGGNSLELGECKKSLNRLINPMQDVSINTGKYKIVARPDNTIRYGVGYSNNSAFFSTFLISCTAYMPAFKRAEEETVYFSQSIKVPLFPLNIPISKGICFGKIAKENMERLYNDGDIETGFIVRFRAEFGDVSCPKVIDRQTGKFIEAAVNLAQGDAVEVSTEAGKKYAKFIRGGKETDIFKNISLASSMSLALHTGLNSFTVTAAQNAANLSNSIKFTPLYLEVQE